MTVDTLIESVPYFSWECKAWDSWRHRIKLDSESVDGYTKRLKSGENLFDLIPGLLKEEPDKFKQFGLRYAIFEKRDEVNIDGENFVSEKGYKEVGGLFVLRKDMMTRERMFLEIKAGLNNSDKSEYLNTLEKHPNSKRFYDYGREPLPDNAIILEDYQIS